jgi:predicted DNA-binding transcriptional regulator AlpA
MSSLVAALSSGRRVSAGRLFGLPELPEDDVWMDIAGVAALTGVKPKTLTGWITRRGPKARPFPPPFRLMYRLYWPRSSVEDWRKAPDETR